MSMENPYREGDYRKTFGYWKQKQVVARAELMKHCMEVLGKTLSEAKAIVTVILSPRFDSKRGDCRGNISAQGHLYYAEKVNRQTRAGVKEPQKFRLRWRITVLEPRRRIEKLEVVGEKASEKFEKEVVAPVKSEVSEVKVQ